MGTYCVPGTILDTEYSGEQSSKPKKRFLFMELTFSWEEDGNLKMKHIF